MTFLLDTNACIRYLNGRAAGVVRRMMTGVIAVANGLTLVTHNAAEFGRIANLMIDDWEANS